jgi:hypothetical protein
VDEFEPGRSTQPFVRFQGLLVVLPAVYPVERLEDDVVEYPARRKVPVVHPADDLHRDVVVAVVGVDHPDEDAGVDDCDRH